MHDGVADFRDCFDDLGTREADEAAVEYKMRVAAAKERERQKRERGLGLLLKGGAGGGKSGMTDSELLDQQGGSVLSKIVGAAPEGNFGASGAGSGLGDAGKKSAVATAVAAGIKGVVAPPGLGEDGKAKKEPVKKKGALFQWFEDSEAEKVRAPFVRRFSLTQSDSPHSLTRLFNFSPHISSPLLSSPLLSSPPRQARLQELKMQHMQEVHTRRLREKMEAQEKALEKERLAKEGL